MMPSVGMDGYGSPTPRMSGALGGGGTASVRPDRFGGRNVRFETGGGGFGGLGGPGGGGAGLARPRAEEEDRGEPQAGGTADRRDAQPT